MNRKLVGGLHRVLRKSPVVVAFLCALILAFVSFYNSNKFHHGATLRVTEPPGLRQMYDEPETSSFRLNAKKPRHQANENAMDDDDDDDDAVRNDSSVKSLKELVRDAVDRGLVVIVNASDADAAHVLADHWHGSRLDISGALDGPMGDILVEVMQELRNVEDMALEVADLKQKIKRLKNTENRSNSTRTPGMVQQQQQGGDLGFRSSGRSLHSLLLFSSFRFALDEFTAVGLAAPSLLPNPIPEVEEDSCTWVEWDDADPVPSPSTTSARVQRGTKRTIVIPEGDAPYAVVVIKCLFADPAGSNGYGGHLFINSTAEDHVPVFSEPRESIDKIQFEGPLQRRFAVCTPPIWKPLNPKTLKEWLMYHHHLLGLDHIHYFFYTGIPLNEATLHVLQPFLDQEMVTIIDWTHSEMVESQFPSSLLARNDCVHRSRFFADWAVIWDFNEFLQMLPPTSFLPLVASNTDLPYIAFGNQRWSSAYCIPEPGPATLNSTDNVPQEYAHWATDRMVFRLELAPCPKNESECVGGEGSRRHLVNPRKVYAVHHHFIIDPSWGGADISTDKARLNQWIGNFLSTEPEQEPTCNIIKEPDGIDPSMAVDGFWFKDLSFALSSQPAHTLAVNASLFSPRLQGMIRR